MSKRDIGEKLCFLLAAFIVMTAMFLACNYYFQKCQILKDKFGYMHSPARCIK